MTNSKNAFVTKDKETPKPSGDNLMEGLNKGADVELSQADEAAIAAMKRRAEEKAKLKAEGYKEYKANGGVFNTCLDNGKPISFINGQYLTDDKDEIDYLEQFVGNQISEV